MDTHYPRSPSPRFSPRDSVQTPSQPGDQSDDEEDQPQSVEKGRFQINANFISM